MTPPRHDDELTDEYIRQLEARKWSDMLKDMAELRVELRAGFENDVRTDKEMEDRMMVDIRSNNKRLERIERIMFISMGALIVIGWFINHVADKILRVLGS